MTDLQPLRDRLARLLERADWTYHRAMLRWSWQMNWDKNHVPLPPAVETLHEGQLRHLIQLIETNVMGPDEPSRDIADPNWDIASRDDPEEDDDDEDDSDPERTPLVGPATDRIRGSDVMAALMEAQANCFDEG